VRGQRITKYLSQGLGLNLFSSAPRVCRLDCETPRAGPRNENVLQFCTERGLDLAGTAECTRGCPRCSSKRAPNNSSFAPS